MSVRKNFSSSQPRSPGSYANKELLIHHSTKNVTPFKAKNFSKSYNSPSSLSPSQQANLSITLPSNFSEVGSQKSSQSLTSAKRELYTKDEFNSMLEFDELHLPEIECTDRSVTISVNNNVDESEDQENLQVSMMTYASDLSKSQIQAARERSRLSNIDNSLYELALQLRTLTDVRAQFLYFRDNAPLKYYSYSCVSDLLSTALSCPPDMPYYILTMAAMMVKSGNVAPGHDLKYYIRVTELLISNPEIFFVTFHADQEKPQKNLRKMLAIFQGKLADLDDDDDYEHSGKMTTKQVEKYISLKKKLDKPSKELYVYSKFDGVWECESVVFEYPESIDLDNCTPGYSPTIELDEGVTLRLETYPDMYTKEEQKTHCFIKELNHDIPKPSTALINFLTSTDSLSQRRKRGNEVYSHLSQKDINVIRKLTSLFTSWDVAYDASLSVWQAIEHNEKFDVEALLSQLPASFGDFLIEAIKSFAEIAGIKIETLKNVR